MINLNIDDAVPLNTHYEMTYTLWNKIFRRKLTFLLYAIMLDSILFSLHVAYRIDFFSEVFRVGLNE